MVIYQKTPIYIISQMCIHNNFASEKLDKDHQRRTECID